jgi:hypothetical protein
MFRRKARGYRAAIRVEKYRAAAEQLRREDPAIYDEILARAEREATRGRGGPPRDPDAFVALFLAEAADAGVIGSSAP